MRAPLLMATGLLLAIVASPARADSGVVTIYSADGLADGSPNWFNKEFEAFTTATGIRVQYIEGGSGAIVDRLIREKSNVQADVLVTLPPFMQKAAADGLLAPNIPQSADQISSHGKDPKGQYYSMIENYPDLIYNATLPEAAPVSYADLLDRKYRNKLQYSTPGQAGDGTAFMLGVFHAFGSKQAGLDYLKKLQTNNRGPSASTGKLTALVNKLELYVANGDLQMNLAQTADNPNVKVLFPTGPDGTKSTFSLPYYVGLVAGAPHSDNGKKLIDFLLSREAQADVSILGRGLPVRSDLKPTDANYEKLNAMLKGVTVWSPDWAAVLADMKGDIAAYNDATSN